MIHEFIFTSKKTGQSITLYQVGSTRQNALEHLKRYSLAGLNWSNWEVV